LERIKLFYKPEVEHYFNELVLNLFNQDYFSYLENAIIYKDKILYFIENNISTFYIKGNTKKTSIVWEKLYFL
jgi:hypothetical protein